MNTQPMSANETSFTQFCRFGTGVDFAVSGPRGTPRFAQVVAYAWRTQGVWYFINLSSENSACVDGVEMRSGGRARIADGAMIAMAGRRFRAHLNERGAMRLEIVRLGRVLVELTDEDLLDDAPATSGGARCD